MTRGSINRFRLDSLFILLCQVHCDLKQNGRESAAKFIYFRVSSSFEIISQTASFQLWGKVIRQRAEASVSYKQSLCVGLCVCGLLELQFQSAVSLRESCHHIADCFRLFLSTFVSPLFFLLNGRTLSDGFRNPEMTEYFCHVSARRQCCHRLVTMCCKWTLKRNTLCSEPFRPELRIQNF